MRCGECRDSWLLKMLRINDGYTLSPRTGMHTTLSKAQGRSWKKKWNENRY